MVLFLFQSPQSVIGLGGFYGTFVVVGQVAEKVDARAFLQIVDAASISFQAGAVVVFVFKPQTESIVLSILDAQDGGEEIFRDDQTCVGAGVVVVVDRATLTYI